MSLATPLLKGVGKPEREIGEASDPIDGEITLPLTTPAGPSNADHFFFSWFRIVLSCPMAYPKRLKVLVTQSAS